MKNTKDNKKDKKVLIGALGIASVIAAGSTFAWFTSSDEVTNRLTAAADYGVSIVEDFTPPEDWLPGQKINKDVSAVNTGNVDAYVRLGILNDLQLNIKGSGVSVNSDATTLPAAPDGEALVELNFTAIDAVPQGANNAKDKVANQVSTLQAGGTLVWTPDGPVSPTDAQNTSSGDDVGSGDEDYDGTDQFKPTKTGLYLFRRTFYEGSGSNEVKYSGYFYDAANTKYYAIETEPKTVYSTATVTEENDIVSAVTGVKLATTKDVAVSNTDTAADKLIGIKWYSSTMDVEPATETTAGNSNAKWIQLTYEAVTGDPVKIDIELASDWATNWTYVQTNNTPKIDDKNDFGYFYYNDIVKAGDTTPKLIDSVAINKNVTQDAYNEMIYDLSVVLDSVQIAKSEDQAEYTNDSITPWVSGATVDGSTGNPTW